MATTALGPFAGTLGDAAYQLGLVALGVCVIWTVFMSIVYRSVPKSSSPQSHSALEAYLRFVYSCFIKPHTGDGSGSQQDALESFYRTQASVYDRTRSGLLSGREDMLALVAAQLKFKSESGQYPRKPVWVDIGGGTGHNIEKMAAYLPVQDFFHAVYLVDLSPSLLEVAKRRFERLGWGNVHVVCQDARSFRLHEHESMARASKEVDQQVQIVRDLDEKADVGGAELLTMSYSLSMMPEFHATVDSVSSLLDPRVGLIAVIDFFVQSSVDYQSRNYTGGCINRHCTWISRVFWRSWFELDRVNLDAARRDYLEYRFGTILSVNARNHIFGIRIPYYIWIGCAKDSGASFEKLVQLDREVTESPFLSALDLQAKTSGRLSPVSEVRSKSYESALVNLSASLPLPASWYQNHHWRVYYEDQQQKYDRFDNTYMYAFTWEDSRADARILKLNSDDVVLALTSGGDNILSFALQGVRRVHAVDLNPAQNHLLELKMAAFAALDYADVWKMFGEGHHPHFRHLLLTKLSPHLSSLALQFWLQNGAETFERVGLYHTGGSGHAIRLAGRLFRLLGLSGEVRRLCDAQTLAEQREVWRRGLRRVLLSQLLSWAVIGNERWLWRALGVPRQQRMLIEDDYQRLAEREDRVPGLEGASSRPTTPTSATSTSSSPPSPLSAHSPTSAATSPTTTPSTISTSIFSPTHLGHAIRDYATATLDPVVTHTLLSADNHYYLLCLQARYSRRCHPEYLTPRSHATLSRAGGAALDSIRLHTDDLAGVLGRFAGGGLTVAVVMDAMDWLENPATSAAASAAAAGPPESPEANRLASLLNRALAPRGRVLLRSAARAPWYLSAFRACGFECRRVGVREWGACVDRVNMYASAWVCAKVREVGVGAAGEGGEGGGGRLSEGEERRLAGLERIRI